ncbi:MAG: hypothetical protein ACE5JU_23905 [Candidatus Binatia bacterium]
MRADHGQEKIDTTLGDLIAALSDVALNLCSDKRAAYLLAGLALEVILKKTPLSATEAGDLLRQECPEETSVH